MTGPGDGHLDCFQLYLFYTEMPQTYLYVYFWNIFLMISIGFLKMEFLSQRICVFLGLYVMSCVSYLLC